MASEYSELYNNDVQKLRDGLDVLERVVQSIDGMDIWFYGIVTNSNILAVARAAIIKEHSIDSFGDSTLEDGDVEVAEIGVYVQVSPDVIDMLKGSGYPLDADKLQFVYQDGEGEGTRTLFFSDSDNLGSDDKIRLADMGELSIAHSEEYIDKYFLDKSHKLKVKINRNVNRTEEATAHPPPEGKQPEVPGAVAPAAPMPKQTSFKLSSLVEDFLG
jgi:hypothetical protein